MVSAEKAKGGCGQAQVGILKIGERGELRTVKGCKMQRSIFGSVSKLSSRGVRWDKLNEVKNQGVSCTVKRSGC